MLQLPMPANPTSTLQFAAHAPHGGRRRCGMERGGLDKRLKEDIVDIEMMERDGGNINMSI